MPFTYTHDQSNSLFVKLERRNTIFLHAYFAPSVGWINGVGNIFGGWKYLQLFGEWTHRVFGGTVRGTNGWDNILCKCKRASASALSMEGANADYC